LKNNEIQKLPRVSRERLVHHFKATYRLDDDQIKVMIDSSARSMNAALAALYQALDENRDLSEIARLGHSIKGLLLNMGETQWAELARELEKAAAQGKQLDFRAIVANIHQGFEDVL
jgi:HPt (histidine-containing phosphotransfer) domain-containing protein